MSSTDNENAIKNKSDKQKPQTLTDSLTTFSTGLVKNLFNLVIHFICGALVLYGCKISQSNILPTDVNCFPYTDTQPNVQPISTNIFTTFTNPVLSMKLNIPYDKANSKNIIIDILRNYKNDSTSSSTGNFFVSLLDGLFSFNYSSIGLVLQLLNYLPEILIVFLGPIVFLLFLIVLLILDHFYLLYLWLSNLGWFMKENVNSNKDVKPRWEYITLLEPINFCWSLFIAFIFFILFWFAIFSFPFLSLFTLSWSVLSTFGYSGTINSKPVGPGTIIKDLFKYYKVTFMVIFSFFAILNTFSSLGTTGGIFCLITLVLINFGIISIDLFKSKPEQGLSALVSTDKAKKTCHIKRHPTLYSEFMDIFSPQQQTSKHLVKELQSAGQILKGGKK